MSQLVTVSMPTINFYPDGLLRQPVWRRARAGLGGRDRLLVPRAIAAIWAAGRAASANDRFRRRRRSDPTNAASAPPGEAHEVAAAASDLRASVRGVRLGFRLRGYLAGHPGGRVPRRTLWCSAKTNRPSASGTQRRSRSNIECNCWREELCSRRRRGTGGRVTRSRRCRICEAQCPGIAAVNSQTDAVGMQETPYINSISARAVRSPVIVRMLRDGDMSQESYHFLPMADHLAQLLHCLMESVACPMASCAEADSRTGYRQRFDDAGVVTGVPAVPQTI